MTDDTADMTVTIFHAEWCGPCTTQQNKFDDFGFEERIDVPVEHVEVDSEDGRERSIENNVRSLPTTLIHDGDEEVSRFIGVTEPAKLISEVGRLQGDE